MNLFPSPIGELHFSIFVSNLYDISQPIVSVPYRGATFLNYYMYISSICKHLFPSPIGELHFSIFITKYDRRNEAQVSVPYRGATFLNEIMMDIVEDYQVSVPYRGATFLNNRKQCYIIQSSTRFPSPIGELHFSMQNSFPLHTGCCVSVPYRGATFLNTIPATPCPVWDE